MCDLISDIISYCASVFAWEILTGYDQIKL